MTQDEARARITDRLARTAAARAAAWESVAASTTGDEAEVARRYAAEARNAANVDVIRFRGFTPAQLRHVADAYDMHVAEAYCGQVRDSQDVRRGKTWIELTREEARLTWETMQSGNFAENQFLAIAENLSVALYDMTRDRIERCIDDASGKLIADDQPAARRRGRFA